MDAERLHAARAALDAARRVVVLSGAGLSAESGIATFRDALTGLWSRFDAQALATPQAFRRDPALVWGWYEWRRAQVMRAEPNAGHAAVHALASASRDVAVVTQNVDDLHERAGSRGVVHLHGSLFAPRCALCRQPWTLPAEPADEPEGGRRVTPPACTACGGPVRPGVVWFGEPLPDAAWSAAQSLVLQADVVLVVGTSGLVQPAASLPQAARGRGARVIVVNADPAAGGVAPGDLFLVGPAARVLPALVAQPTGLDDRH